MTRTTNKGITLALAVIVASGTAACGRLLAAKNRAEGKGQGQADQTHSPSQPPPSQPLLVDKDVETWAKTALSGMTLPAATGANVKPYDSCDQYYNEMVAYAEAQQAIYVKRYLAWARYQLAVNGFATYSYQPEGAGMPGVGASGGGPGVNAASTGAGQVSADTAQTQSAPSTPAKTASTPSPTAPGAVASEYSTNNQVTGVDETDYVKSNGQFVFVASGRLLRVIDLNGKVVFAKPLGNESAQGLHQSGNKLLLITSSTVETPMQEPVYADAYGTPNYWWSYWDYRRHVSWYATNLTNVHEFSINSDGTLTPGRDRVYHGTFSDGREINGIVHLVMQKQLPWEILGTGFDIALNPAYAGIIDEAALLAYAQRVAQDNLNAWRQNMFESGDLMAEAQDSYVHGHCQAFTHLTSASADPLDGGKLGQLYNSWDGALVYANGIAESAYQAYPMFPAYDHVTTVATLDLAGSGDDVLGMTIGPVTPDIVYASDDQLVVGNTRYQWYDYWRTLYVLPAIGALPPVCFGTAGVCTVFGASPVAGANQVMIVPIESLTQSTTFFDFLSYKLGATGAIATGFGTLTGSPLGSYAIDAGSSTLRFVVTESLETTPVAVVSTVNNTTVGVAAGYSSSQNAASLVVMSLSGSDWTKAAELPLSVGGAVGGVRFIGSAAFISLTDPSQPLFAVDLSNELAPRLAGAMPAAMQSSYFEPMGDGKTILALGRTNQPVTTATGYSGYALSVAMIDVSDLAAPTVLATASLDVGGSAAEYDFKSFRFVPRLGLLVLPMSWPFRLELLAAKPATGFAHFGTVNLQDALTDTFGTDGNPRTLLFDDLLVGVFGSQDVGATLNYAARAPALTFSKSLELDYQTKVVPGWSSYWYLEGANMITPKWRSMTTASPQPYYSQPGLD